MFYNIVFSSKMDGFKPLTSEQVLSNLNNTVMQNQIGQYKSSRIFRIVPDPSQDKIEISYGKAIQLYPKYKIITSTI